MERAQREEGTRVTRRSAARFGLAGFVVLLIVSFGDDVVGGHGDVLDHFITALIDLIFVWLVIRGGRRAVIGVMVVIAIFAVAEAAAGRWIAAANGVAQIALLIPVLADKPDRIAADSPPAESM
jgi:hypothetical protein